MKTQLPHICRKAVHFGEICTCPLHCWFHIRYIQDKIAWPLVSKSRIYRESCRRISHGLQNLTQQHFFPLQNTTKCLFLIAWPLWSFCPQPSHCPCSSFNPISSGSLSILWSEKKTVSVSGRQICLVLFSKNLFWFAHPFFSFTLQMINSCEGNKRVPKGEKNKRIWKFELVTPLNVNFTLCLESDIDIVRVATKNFGLK